MAGFGWALFWTFFVAIIWHKEVIKIIEAIK